MEVATSPATPITKLDKKLEYVWMKWPILEGEWGMGVVVTVLLVLSVSGSADGRSGGLGSSDDVDMAGT
jgi:hypothetical protein